MYFINGSIKQNSQGQWVNNEKMPTSNKYEFKITVSNYPTDTKKFSISIYNGFEEKYIDFRDAAFLWSLRKCIPYTSVSWDINPKFPGDITVEVNKIKNN